jgi:hypothetical protein
MVQQEASQLLLQRLVKAFAPSGPLLVGVDETLERRRGEKIAQKGIYRDAARSSKSFFVKPSGPRWISMMLLVPAPWAARVWALPFFSVLAPSQRYNLDKGRRHKTLIILLHWARQMVKQLCRWIPEREVALVADQSYAVLSFLHACATLAKPVTVITRLRLDAGLYEPAPIRQPGQKGRPRKRGKRLPNLEQRLFDAQTSWTKMTVPRWYSLGERELVGNPARTAPT